ncbi:50S ribosomal protein L17 [Bacteroidia bacterium]|nr:50S ribosomal protein L17 [Bacteroidia bacterium]
MRHGKKFNHLGRKTGHRKAMLSNMASSLLTHKRIFTTTAKAKALRVYVEPLITKSKDNTTHSRRVVFSYLQSKDAVNELFTAIAPKVADRPGGYTRILKTGNRLGDNADMCMMELVDFNESMLEAKSSKAKAKSGAKRTRRGKKTETAALVAAAKSEESESAEVSADDLTKIEGIGPKMASVFTAAGISTYADMASKTTEDLRAVLDAAEGNFASHDPGTWSEQAKMAADGKWDELKKWQDELDGGK